MKGLSARSNIWCCSEFFCSYRWFVWWEMRQSCSLLKPGTLFLKKPVPVRFLRAVFQCSQHVFAVLSQITACKAWLLPEGKLEKLFVLLRWNGYYAVLVCCHLNFTLLHRRRAGENLQQASKSVPETVITWLETWDALDWLNTAVLYFILRRSEEILITCQCSQTTIGKIWALFALSWILLLVTRFSGFQVNLS